MSYYVDNLIVLSSIAWPALLFLVFVQIRPVSRYSLFALLSIILYALPTAIGGSPRALLVLMPMFIPPMAFLLLDAVSRIKTLRPGETSWRAVWGRSVPVAAIVLLGLVQLSIWVKEDSRTLLASRWAYQQFLEVQQVLVEEGMKSPDEVFTDNFDLYFPELPPYRPRMNGGWFVYSLYGYNEKYGQLTTQSPSDFIADCRRQGIRFLVLTPRSRDLAEFLFRQYNEEEVAGLGKITLIGKVGLSKIFALR